MSLDVRSVAILGVDGAGKTTLATLIAKALSATGTRVELYTRSAGVRLTDPPTARTDRAMWAASAMRESMAAVDDHGLWVSDRFSFCHYAVDRLSPEPCEPVLRTVFGALRPPDVVVWLDVPVTEALRRVIERGEDEETIEYLSGLRDAYLSLPEAADFVVVDATRPVDDVRDSIRREIGW